MNIAVFTDCFLPQINGVVTATLNLVKGLADRGHKVVIVAPKAKMTPEFSYPGVRVVRLHSMPALFYEEFKFTLPYSFRVMRLLRKEKIDLIHFQTPITLGLFSIVAAKRLGLPLVGTFHTFFADPVYLKHLNVKHASAEKIAWKYGDVFFNRCDLLTAPSPFTAREVSAHLKGKHVKVISNGIDFSLFDNRNSPAMRKKYAPNDEKLFLFIGRISLEKNIDYLIECFAQAQKTAPKARLLIVGGGPQQEEVEKRVKELGLSQQILFLGKIPHAELVKSGLFGACHAFITASTSENQPMTILEALANGLPCVCVAAKGVPDIVKNNVNGLLAKEGDKKEFAKAIADVANNEALHAKLSKGAAQEAKTHSLESVALEWEKTYKEVIEKKKHSKGDGVFDEESIPELKEFTDYFRSIGDRLRASFDQK